jgi:hypothetical protein
MTLKARSNVQRAVSQKPAGGKRYKVILIAAHLPPKAYSSSYLKPNYNGPAG